MSNLLETSSGTGYHPQKGTNGAAHVHLASSVFAAIPPFNAILYNALANGISVADMLQDYDDWLFQISGVAATNDIITISGSLDGAVFTDLQLINTASGAVVTNIIAAGIYKLGDLTNTQIRPMRFRALKVTKTGTTPALTSIVSATGGWD